MYGFSLLYFLSTRGHTQVNNLSFDGIVCCLNEVIGKINDPRSASNATKYSLREAILGAFAAFFLQNESFLAHIPQVDSRDGIIHLYYID